MTHEDVVNSQAVEKYLLAELSLDEREHFEQHYFECPECAAEVQVAESFAANARAVLAEEAGRRATYRPVKPRKVLGLLGWRRPAFALAWGMAALFAVLSLVLQMRLNRLGAPQAYPAFFLHGTARGDEQVLRAQRTARFVGLSLDVPPGHSPAKYQCALQDPAGHTRCCIDLPAPSDPGASLNVLVPVSGMTSGRYTLVLYSGGAELGRYPFILQIQ